MFAADYVIHYVDVAAICIPRSWYLSMEGFPILHLYSILILKIIHVSFDVLLDYNTNEMFIALRCADRVCKIRNKRVINQDRRVS